ncbi:MAG: hypothetical protein QOH37_3027, partial [Nocardioidaceae bacterium]|nr:hypothetical protein [Nocardioidaceae bacterium]
MKAVVRLAVGLALWPALTGCLGGGHAGPNESTSAVVARVVGIAEAGSDVGNDRPLSSHDGRMVRRREVLALRIDATADLPAMDRRLTSAARRSHLAVSPIASGVLAPTELDRLAPDLVVSLPPRTTPFEAEQLMRLTLRAARRSGVDVQGRLVASVLVHDLRLTLRTAHPAEVSRAIDREG